MVSRLRFTLLLPLAALLACGSSSPLTGISVSTLITGDYVFVISPSAAGANMLNGAMTVAGSSVTGTFQYTNPQQSSCIGQTMTLTGTIASSVLTLTSNSFAGSVATFTVQLPLSANNIGATLGSGTAVITGGSCALASAPLQVQYIPSFSGTWTVTLTSPSNVTDTLTVSESAVNQIGQFPATGTLVQPGNSSGSITLTGQVIGAALQLANTVQNVQVTANDSAVPVTVDVSGATGTMTH